MVSTTIAGTAGSSAAVGAAEVPGTAPATTGTATNTAAPPPTRMDSSPARRRSSRGRPGDRQAVGQQSGGEPDRGEGADEDEVCSGVHMRQTSPARASSKTGLSPDPGPVGVDPDTLSNRQHRGRSSQWAKWTFTLLSAVTVRPSVGCQTDSTWGGRPGSRRRRDGTPAPLRRRSCRTGSVVGAGGFAFHRPALLRREPGQVRRVQQHVPPPQPLRLQAEPPQPLQRVLLHPRRAGSAAGRRGSRTPHRRPAAACRAAGASRTRRSPAAGSRARPARAARRRP